jgi:hypothetical protein
MANYFGDATRSQHIDDPRGCYVGKAAVRLETTTATIVWTDQSLPLQSALFKVPARAFLPFWQRGAQVRLTPGGVVLALGEHFRAVLPSVAAPHYCDDLTIRDHRTVSPAAFRELVRHISRAHRFCAATGHPLSGCVYLGERWVFASNGHHAYFGRLSERLPCRLVFTVQACREVQHFWEHQEATEIKMGPRSLLARTERMAMAVRCADATLADRLYRTVGRIQLRRPFARVATHAFRDAMDLLRHAHSVDGPICFHWTGGSIEFVGPNGTVKLVTEDFRRGRRSGWLSLTSALLAAHTLTGTHIALTTLPHLSANLTFGGSRSDHAVAIPLHRQPGSTIPTWWNEEQTKEGVRVDAAPRLLPSDEVMQSIWRDQLQSGLAQVRDGDTSALAWLNSTSTDSPLAFERLAQALRLDPDGLRAGVLHAMHQGMQWAQSSELTERSAL